MAPNSVCAFCVHLRLRCALGVALSRFGGTFPTLVGRRVALFLFAIMNAVVVRCAIIPGIGALFCSSTMNIRRSSVRVSPFTRFNLRIPRVVALYFDTGLCGDTSARGGPRAPTCAILQVSARGSEPSMYPGTTSGLCKKNARMGRHNVHVCM